MRIQPVQNLSPKPRRRPKDNTAYKPSNTDSGFGKLLEDFKQGIKSKNKK